MPVVKRGRLNQMYDTNYQRELKESFDGNKHRNLHHEHLFSKFRFYKTVEFLTAVIILLSVLVSIVVLVCLVFLLDEFQCAKFSPVEGQLPHVELLLSGVESLCSGHDGKSQCQARDEDDDNDAADANDDGIQYIRLVIKLVEDVPEFPGLRLSQVRVLAAVEILESRRVVKLEWQDWIVLDLSLDPHRKLYPDGGVFIVHLHDVSRDGPFAMVLVEQVGLLIGRELLRELDRETTV